MAGSNTKVLADVTDATHPHTICTITGNWAPLLVTQRMISWSATQNPGSAGPSVLATLDLFSGSTALIASWQGGLYMDGVHAWSADESAIGYITSSSTAVNLHVLSGGGDRVIATYGAVPGRGVNPDEDSSFLGFSSDGKYLAMVQTFTSGGAAHLQIRKTTDGTLAYSQATGTMATWSSTGSQLYFREPSATTIRVWDPTSGVSQLFGLQQAWIRPVSDAGDTYTAYTVRDGNGNPHVWLYGYGGRAGGQLGNVRSSPAFLNSSQLFLVEEAPCGNSCGPGPPTTPDSKTFIYNIGNQGETPSSIATVYSAWPRPGQ
jgi:hypothetical protein